MKRTIIVTRRGCSPRRHGGTEKTKPFTTKGTKEHGGGNPISSPCLSVFVVGCSNLRLSAQSAAKGFRLLLLVPGSSPCLRASVVKIPGLNPGDFWQYWQ